jgi:hypothetical protein
MKDCNVVQASKSLTANEKVGKSERRVIVRMMNELWGVVLFGEFLCEKMKTTTSGGCREILGYLGIGSY